MKWQVFLKTLFIQNFENFTNAWNQSSRQTGERTICLPGTDKIWPHVEKYLQKEVGWAQMHTSYEGILARIFEIEFEKTHILLCMPFETIPIGPFSACADMYSDLDELIFAGGTRSLKTLIKLDCKCNL